ncbi:MAG TPA: Gfo/Idh/MocA family oxidoreductase [Lacipirellulaceae bacterium]|nr:Gfo/Idh/MocA family oxidoreductase [Lacipirellulaceae bacterium]
MEATSRRSFLKHAGTGSLAAVALAAPTRAASANDKIVVGLIGCGVRGHRFFEYADYVCDPDTKRLGAAAKQAGVDASRAVADMRRLFDNNSIDAVVIATPDHWHAPAALLALQAGKHVYVEKPCSHNFRESQLLLEAGRDSGRVVQHGTQQRSAPRTQEIMAMLRDGVIGHVLVAKAWNVQLRPNIGHARPSQPPPGVDYDLWVGPAEFTPFQANRFHYNWHWWYQFGTGDIGNDGTHEIDIARWGLGVDTLPSKVAAIGGKYFHDDDQQFPDTATCIFEYPGDGKAGHRRQLVFEMRLWSTNYPYNCDTGVEFTGTEGKLMFSKRGKLEILGPRNKVIKQEQFKSDPSTEHMENFLATIRSGTKPNAPLEEAHRSVALVHLANIAVRKGRSFAFDPERQQIVGDDQANQLMKRSYRHGGHWAIPRGV